jgi:hypothetical protein
MLKEKRMNDFRLRISRASKTILGDVVFNMLMVFALLFIVLPHSPKREEVKKGDVISVNDMEVVIIWPGCRKYVTEGQFPKCREGERVNIDIDLWGKSADDERPVGYSNRAGLTFNLIRDDLGTTNDSTDQNTETLVARGLPAGEYIINLHYFKNQDPGEKPPEVPVSVVIKTRVPGVAKETGGMKEIITQKATLRSEGEEITVARFVIKEDGELDKESVNDFYQELRTWQPPTQ